MELTFPISSNPPVPPHYTQTYATPLSTTKNLATKKDIIEHTIIKTKETIQSNFHTINKLTTTTNVTKRGKIALHDCLELVAGTLEALNQVIVDLRAYPTKKPIRTHSHDLITLMSTTITNKETCLDGFSHEDLGCKVLRDSIVRGKEHGGKMCSNALAMIVNMTNTDMLTEVNELDIEEVTMWPEWLSIKVCFH